MNVNSENFLKPERAPDEHWKRDAWARREIQRANTLLYGNIPDVPPVVARNVGRAVLRELRFRFSPCLLCDALERVIASSKQNNGYATIQIGGGY